MIAALVTQVGAELTRLKAPAAPHGKIYHIAQTAAKQEIAAGQLTLPADRGSSMISKPVAFLFADLGMTKTHSHPHVSNDNPY